MKNDMYDELNAGRSQYDAQQELLTQEDAAFKKKGKSTNLFEFTKDILYRNNKHVDFRGYVPHVVNKHFSFSSQTVMMANVMNQAKGMPSEVQFEFLRCAVRKQEGSFIRWQKREEDDRIPLLMEVYKYSYEKAKQVVDLLSPEQYEKLKMSLDKGGRG